MNARRNNPGPAQVYDDVLTWEVPSRTNPKICYRVEVDAYAGNGECACKDFQTRFGPLLARGYTPQKAWDEGLIKGELRPYQRTNDDLLRCAHIVEARDKLATHIIRAFAKASEALRAGSEG